MNWKLKALIILAGVILAFGGYLISLKINQVNLPKTKAQDASLDLPPAPTNVNAQFVDLSKEPAQ